MITRKAIHRASGSVLVKPLVVLAARTLGPGPLRLRMVKLAHELSDGGRPAEPEFPLDEPLIPDQRAA
jgi:hypothetical protein